MDPEPSRFQELVSQMKYRLTEGQGEALYEVGVEDDGSVRGLSPQDLEKSLETIFAMAEELDAAATVVMERSGPLGKVHAGPFRQCRMSYSFSVKARTRRAFNEKSLSGRSLPSQMFPSLEETLMP
eukprot:2780148-Pyramimonas_sp.AAC.1